MTFARRPASPKMIVRRLSDFSLSLGSFINHCARCDIYEAMPPRLSMEDREGTPSLLDSIKIALRRGGSRAGSRSRHQLQAEDISEGREMDPYWGLVESAGSWGTWWLRTRSDRRVAGIDQITSNKVALPRAVPRYRAKKIVNTSLSTG
ncbi:hypothetical protein C8R46DRAFT_1042454 [Mycena filopes]|nr:hypothetical protein C8R46DRAFT_1042454 [Mycena filopes]